MKYNKKNKMPQKNFILIVFLAFLNNNIMNSFVINNQNGFLCTIEGIDGSGKTTLLKNLEQRFAQEKFNVFFTRQPGGTNFGKQLRSILLEKKVPVCPFAEFLLFAADRAQHFQEFIIPKLTAGALIISDRMADSSMAYQGYLKGIDINKIQTINSWCMQNIEPDVVFYLKISAQEAQHRIKKTRAISDKFEEELIDHLDKLVSAFDTIFQNRKNVIIINALEDTDAIADFVFKKIIALYQAKLTQEEKHNGYA
jgi:dTMP kinase